MSRTRKRFSIGVVAVVAVSALLFVATPLIGQQMSTGLTAGQSGENAEVGPPEPLLFCTGKKCAGSTCDELNDVCVGNVTLQPPAGERLVGLKAAEVARFENGKVLFDTVFIESTGLGPVFNQNSCSSCHNTPIGGSGSITVNRFGDLQFVGPGPLDFTFDPLAELGGSLLNQSSIDFANCSETFPIPQTTYAAKRLTNSTMGFGLVEAIADADIEFNALNPPAPGISGKAHIVPVLENPGETGVGRFGWKCQLKTVLSFSADAMVQEMGITNHILTEDNPPQNDLIKLAACDTVADPEEPIDAQGKAFVDAVTDFQRFLAPPPQTPRSGMTGEAIFNEIGCADCHIGTWTSNGDDEGVEKAIRNKTFSPYSDFLLHDMGFNADLIEQGDASITEIRTTPLWGLRLRDPLWHDGRVGGGNFSFRINNAIGEHNDSFSEAQPSAAAYAALSVTDKQFVLDFMNSLGRREFDMDGDNDVDAADVAATEACAAGVGPYTPDDACAVADVDQDGDVDDLDLELLAVALIYGQDGMDDEDEDEDGDGPGKDKGGKGNGGIVIVGDGPGSGAESSSDLTGGNDQGQKAKTLDLPSTVTPEERKIKHNKAKRISRRGQ